MNIIKFNNIRESKSPGKFINNDNRSLNNGFNPTYSPQNNYDNDINNNSTSVNHIYLNLNNKVKEPKMKITNHVEGSSENINTSNKKKKNFIKTFFKKTNLKNNFTDKKSLNYTNNFKNTSKEKRNNIGRRIDFSFANKNPINIKRSGTEEQFISFEKEIPPADRIRP